MARYVECLRRAVMARAAPPSVRRPAPMPHIADRRASYLVFNIEALIIQSETFQSETFQCACRGTTLYDCFQAVFLGVAQEVWRKRRHISQSPL